MNPEPWELWIPEEERRRIALLPPEERRDEHRRWYWRWHSQGRDDAQGKLFDVNPPDERLRDLERRYRSSNALEDLQAWTVALERSGGQLPVNELRPWRWGFRDAAPPLLATLPGGLSFDRYLDEVHHESEPGDGSRFLIVLQGHGISEGEGWTLELDEPAGLNRYMLGELLEFDGAYWIPIHVHDMLLDRSLDFRFCSQVRGARMDCTSWLPEGFHTPSREWPPVAAVNPGPDESLRRLERQAATGDPRAQARYHRALARADRCSVCEGDLPPPGSHAVTGAGAKICYACAARTELEHLRLSTHKFSGYLSRYDPSANLGATLGGPLDRPVVDRDLPQILGGDVNNYRNYVISNFVGFPLLYVDALRCERELRRSGSRRPSTWLCYWRGRDRWGRSWFSRNGGLGMHTQMTLTAHDRRLGRATRGAYGDETRRVGRHRAALIRIQNDWLAYHEL